eukprot:Clim_evm95s210 gene=Clim_evmTU95s210
MAEAFNSLLANPGPYRDILNLVKGVRNGLVYGIKIRFPHALVMTLLFKSGNLQQMARGIFRATKQHARNLGTFVFIYKTLNLALRKVTGVEKMQEWHPFVAGLIGGYYVFGENNNVNNQINMYLFSRIIFGLIRTAKRRGVLATPDGDSHPIFASLVWAIVMWLFEFEPGTLQPSLRASMDYLYHDSEKYDNLNNFLWYNKPGLR